MNEFFSYEFFIGLILGGLVVLAVYPLFKKKSDLGNFKQSIANIENALDNIKKSDENQIDVCAFHVDWCNLIL